jgi:hypothetical protein
MIPFLKKYFASLYIPLLWTLVVGTLCFLPGSMLPNEAHFPIPQFDKFVHIPCSAVLSFCGTYMKAKRVAEPDRLLKLFFPLVCAGNIYGIGSEYVQKYWIPGRDYDQADIIADMIGAGGLWSYGLSPDVADRRPGFAAGKK